MRARPVVATEAVSIIRNFEDGLLAYIQPESIAWCINRLLRSPEEMKKLGFGRAEQNRKGVQLGQDRGKDRGSLCRDSRAESRCKRCR